MNSTSAVESIICLDLPLNVVNVDKAVDMVGGSTRIAQSRPLTGIAKDSASLELKLRPNEFHHAISSIPMNSRNIVIQIDLPAECVSTRSGSITDPIVNVKASLANAKAQDYSVPIRIKYTIELLHRFREIADFQYYCGDSDFVNKCRSSIFKGNLEEIQKLSLKSQTSAQDILPPPKFSVNSQPFYYGYKQSPYLKVVDDESGQQRLVPTASSVKVISNILNWGDKVPAGPPVGLEEKPRSAVEKCVAQLKLLFDERPSYTRRALQHKVGPVMARYLKFALPYVSYYYRSGPWRGAYIKYGNDPSTQNKMARYQVEHFRITTEITQDIEEDMKGNVDLTSNISTGDYVFNGETFPDVPLLQLCDIADGFLEQYINTAFLRSEVHSSDGWYTEETILRIRKILRAELVALKESKTPLTKSQKEIMINQ